MSDASVLSREPHLAKSGRIPGSQPRVPAHAALGARAGKPGLGAFPDQGALKLRRSAQDLQRELALRGCGIDRILNRAKESAFGLKPLDHLE